MTKKPQKAEDAQRKQKLWKNVALFSVGFVQSWKKRSNNWKPPNFKGKQKLVHLFQILLPFQLIFHLWIYKVSWGAFGLGSIYGLSISLFVSRYLIIYDPLFISGFQFASFAFL